MIPNPRAMWCFRDQSAAVFAKYNFLVRVRLFISRPCNRCSPSCWYEPLVPPPVQNHQVLCQLHSPHVCDTFVQMSCLYQSVEGCKAYPNEEK